MDGFEKSETVNGGKQVDSQPYHIKNLTVREQDPVIEWLGSINRNL